MTVPVSLWNVSKKVMSKLTSLTYQKYHLYLSFELDFNKLQSDLTSISAVLLDAEKQQEKSHSVQDWLGKLQDALYDAEDLLDDLNAEVLRQKVENEFRIVTLVRNFFFLTGMDERVKNIRDRIEHIEKQKRNLHLPQLVNGKGNGVSVNNMDSHRQREREHTRSYLHFTEVVGREKDKKEVIELLCGSCNSDEGVCVVPIVGMGGLGKTALAHLVFDNDEVKRGFDLRIWVDVSDDFNLERIWEKKITRGVNCSDHNVLDIDILSSLQDKVSGKKFLLVLDDVWRGNQIEWLDLKSALISGGAKGGSRVLVTTRYKSTMGRFSSYNLGVLPDGDCWSLFEKWAFGEGETAHHPNLATIGIEIVKKCGGVPLAIRTVGGLLSESKEESYWLYVKDSDAWGMDIGHMLEWEDNNNILSVLKLSYDQLPPHLKECFAYCSSLPKGLEFRKEDLIQLWMSQGFIHLSDRYQQSEDVGSWYFNELVSRSIFDVVHENHRTEIVKCRMHDLFHDLAKSVARPLVVNYDITNMSERTRHLSLWDLDLREDPNSFLKLLKLRTLILLPTGLGTSLGSGSYLDVLLSGSTYLRVLDLSRLGIKHLPNSIGYMKHLRYLNLNGNSELQSLPDSICRLHSLQILKLSGCRKISTLPRNFSYLVSLRHLVITSPHVLEQKVGTLTSLRSLTIEHCRNLESLSEVTQNLSVLRTLRIHNCGKLTSLPSNLENCTALENLEVVNCKRMRSLEVSMQRLAHFRSLTIKGLPGLVTLPDKLECYARSLQYLFITDCVILQKLPKCLEKLSSLMRVYIMYCPNLHKLPSGFCHLTALQVLRIEGCPYLSSRCQRKTGQDWHLIAHVREIYVDNDKI
ncbi:hypothetical protein TanjilG_32351 [Lupinus angustifolius]|uniref:Uncharacterized protein n=1 Tax=Lupinus angustifolius TaxID=3871 RepID=A0A4P1R0L0_LUPAN|nr:PREDICTED: disease resistance protein RGA2-like [Lupinus angustifolius]OIV99092.1 hypothetical protein TanjilG_32351 [Lupinus angustifolius]